MKDLSRSQTLRPSGDVPGTSCAGWNEYLTGQEIVSFNQRKIIEQAKFAYSPLGKAFEKQTEKQVDVIKSLNPSNKLKQIEGIFP